MHARCLGLVPDVTSWHDELTGRSVADAAIQAEGGVSVGAYEAALAVPDVDQAFRAQGCDGVADGGAGDLVAGHELGFGRQQGLGGELARKDRIPDGGGYLLVEGSGALDLRHLGISGLVS